MPAQRFFGFGLRQGVQLVEELRFVAGFVQVAEKLDALLDVLHVDVFVHV